MVCFCLVGFSGALGDSSRALAGAWCPGWSLGDSGVRFDMMQAGLTGASNRRLPRKCFPAPSALSRGQDSEAPSVVETSPEPSLYALAASELLPSAQKSLFGAPLLISGSERRCDAETPATTADHFPQPARPRTTSARPRKTSPLNAVEYMPRTMPDTDEKAGTSIRIVSISAAQNKRGKNCFEGGMKQGNFTWRGARVLRAIAAAAAPTPPRRAESGRGPRQRCGARFRPWHSVPRTRFGSGRAIGT